MSKTRGMRHLRWSWRPTYLLGWQSQVERNNPLAWKLEGGRCSFVCQGFRNKGDPDGNQVALVGYICTLQDRTMIGGLTLLTTAAFYSTGRIPC
jgi:hypothetical protein